MSNYIEIQIIFNKIRNSRVPNRVVSDNVQNGNVVTKHLTTLLSSGLNSNKYSKSQKH